MAWSARSPTSATGISPTSASPPHTPARLPATSPLHRADALAVLDRLPDASLRFVYLPHPDPGPKARHAKRRMINLGPLDLITAKLEPGGELRLGTDDPV